MNENTNSHKGLKIALSVAACILAAVLAFYAVLPGYRAFRDRGVTEAFATPEPTTTPSPDEKIKQ